METISSSDISTAVRTSNSMWQDCQRNLKETVHLYRKDASLLSNSVTISLTIQFTWRHFPHLRDHCTKTLHTKQLFALHWQPFYFHNTEKRSAIFIFSPKFIHISLPLSLTGLFVLALSHTFFHVETNVMKCVCPATSSNSPTPLSAGFLPVAWLFRHQEVRGWK
jgi:hypothetical protein